jgi:serine/threonine protein kinase
MDTNQICKECGQPLPENAPEGLCPACLAKVALGTEPAAPGGTIHINPLAGQAAPGTRVPPDVAQLAAQFPQLEIIELLGMGGMGMVYKARQPRLDRFVALKILPVDSAAHPSFAERFNREAKALAKLNHPGIVAVYDFGQTGQYYYFIMEYVDGMNLRMLLNDQHVTPRQALELVVQICTALQYAHDEGVVHRDIKPENILINKKGQVKIADFGLAKLLGAAPDTSLTQSQAAMGTLNYMAPEQRENSKDVDHRADIYSLGVVLYEMLTGEVPVGRFEPPSKKVLVDVRLDEVVLRALEREPARRYQQASEVKSRVEAITSPGIETSTQDAKASTATPVSSQPRLSRAALAGVACLILLVGVIVNSMVFDLYTRPPGHFEPAPPPPGWPSDDPYQKFVQPLTGWRVAVVTSWMLAIVSVLGMTVSGWVAVTQIRRSSGVVYGLALALFDGLFLPLLFLDSLLFVPTMVIFLRLSELGNDANRPITIFILLAAFGIVASVVLDYLIVRRVWRFCRQ